MAVVAPRDPADPPTPTELDAWCRERLARYKNPREYSFVGALPRNPSGKVLKTRLREEHTPPDRGSAGPDLGDLREHRRGLPATGLRRGLPGGRVEHVLADRDLAVAVG